VAVVDDPVKAQKEQDPNEVAEIDPIKLFVWSTVSMSDFLRDVHEIFLGL
jgi:hypothetical protein